jgi:hypothetical protein
MIMEEARPAGHETANRDGASKGYDDPRREASGYMELHMRAYRYTRRGLTLAATAALLTATACAATATAAPDGTHHPARAATPGWRVVKKFGPYPSGVSGVLTAASAGDAWSVWSGSKFTLVEHFTRGAWRRVPLPSGLDGYVRSAVSIGASSASDVWIFGTHPATKALRWTGAKWRLQTIPSWVLRRSSGTVTATSAVFGPGNVWVFSLGNGAFAAHYNGHSWAKVKMPAVPIGVSAAAPGDIWALGPGISSVMHWNGTKWGRVGLPLLPLPAGTKVSYSNITAVGPGNAWLMRSVTFPKATTPATNMMHWNGKAWLTVASPSDIVGSLVPDGHGGLWADGIDINPGGFWFIYHLAGGHWTQAKLPAIVFPHAPEELTWIPGTRSVWATGLGFNIKGNFGVILKFGP